MRPLAITSLALALVACGPETTKRHSPEAQRYAAAICEAHETCACVERFESGSACEDEIAGRFDLVAEEDELVESCLDHVIEATDCATIDMREPADDCVVFVADLGDGERCNPHAELPGVDVEECAEGLECSRGKCQPKAAPSIPGAAGDPCDPSADTICNASDLYCGDDGTCHVRSAEGDACSSPFGCFDPQSEALLNCAGAFSGTGICAPIPGIGQACEPLDADNCIASPPPSDGSQFAWCNPGTRVCEAGRAPAICEAFDWPSAWP